MQLVFRTPTRTPTGVIRGCFSLFAIIIKPLKNLRFWLPLIQENRPIFSSSPVATTTKTLDFQGFFHFHQGQIPQPYPNRLFAPALLNGFVRKGAFFISVDRYCKCICPWKSISRSFLRFFMSVHTPTDQSGSEAFLLIIILLFFH